jgi:predicted anti-sigma-YlaC factor YlaD
MEGLMCREVIMDFLADYLDGTLDSRTAEEVEGHLRLCRACMAYLNTYRLTRELLGRQAAQAAMPEEMKDILRRFMRERMAREGS